MNDTPTPEHLEIKTLNRWLLVLVIFVTLWSIGMFVYISERTDHSEVKNGEVPLVMDGNTGKIINPALTNLFPTQFVSLSESNAAINIKTNVPAKIRAFEQKSSYEVMDFVIINYFFVQGIVIEKNGDSYTIIYKDQNRTLQRVTVPKELLVVPTSATWMNPTGLIGD